MYNDDCELQQPGTKESCSVLIGESLNEEAKEEKVTFNVYLQNLALSISDQLTNPLKRDYLDPFFQQ